MKILITMIFLQMFTYQAYSQIKDPIKWGYAAKKGVGNEYILYLKAELNKGWHIYSTYQKDGGPERTKFTFAPNKDYILLGRIGESKPIRKYENVLDLEVLYFDNSVVFTQKIRVNAKQTVIKGKIEFMVCTDEECLPRMDVAFSIPIN